MSWHCPKILRNQMTKEEATALWDEVLYQVGLTIGTPTDQVPAIKDELSIVNQELKVIAEIPPKELTKQIRERVKELKKRTKVLITRAKFEPSRLKRHNNIYHSLLNYIAQVMVDTHMTFSYQQIIDAARIVSQTFIGMDLVDLNNQNKHQVRQMEALMKRFILTKPNTKKLGWFAEYSQDIWRMMAKRDHTGIGVALLDNITGLKDAIFDESAPFDDRDIENQRAFNTRIESVLGQYSNTLGELVFRETAIMTEDEFGDEVPLKTWEQMSPKEQQDLLLQDYKALLRDLADGRVRYMQPILYQDLTDEEKNFVNETVSKKFAKTEHGEEFRGLSHREMSITDEKDPEIQSSWVILKRNEGGNEEGKQHEYYVTVMSRKGARTPDGEISFMMTLGKQGEHLWENSGMQEGFFEAQKFTQYNYVQPNTSQRQTSYSHFKRMEKQPNDDIAGINAPIMKEEAKQINIWEALRQERLLHDDFFTYLKDNYEDVNNKLEEARMAAEQKVLSEQELNPSKPGIVHDMSMTSLLEDIDSSGQMSANMQETDAGWLIGWDTYIQKVSHNYDPRIYEDLFYWNALDEAINQTQRDITDIEKDLDLQKEVINAYEDGLQSGEQVVSGEEFAEAMESISQISQRLERWGSQLSTLQRMKKLSLNPPTKENIKEMKILSRTVFAKHRKTLMNPLNRRRDGNLNRDYFNKAITAIQYSRLKIEMMKAMNGLDNPHQKKWLINQSKIAMGDMSHKAGFMGIEYGFEEAAEALNSISKAMGSTRRFSPQEVAKMVSGHNNWVSGNILNTGSAVQNYSQLVSMVETFGISIPMRAHKMRNRADVKEALKFSGVTSLINAYTDFMSGGSTNDIGFSTPLKTRAAQALLFMSKSKFINRRKIIPLDKWLISLLPEKDRISWKSLKKQRKALYEQFEILRKMKRDGDGRAIPTRREIRILKNRINRMNKKLHSSQVNLAASWMLEWLFDEKLKVLTFSGAEINMRELTCTVGFILSEEFQLLNEKKTGNKFKQKPALMWGRSHTYMTMFGMSKEFFPKMFSGLGQWGFQYRTYPYKEYVREWNLIEDFLASNPSLLGIGYVSALARAGGAKTKRLAGRLTGKKPMDWSELMRSKDPHFNMSAERMFNHLFGRGLMSLLTTGFFWSPFMEGVNFALRRATKNAFSPRGLQSIIISHIIKAIYLLGIATSGAGGDDDEKEEQINRDLIMLFFPLIVTVMYGLYNQNFSSIRPYIPYVNSFEFVKGIYDDVVD